MKGLHPTVLLGDGRWDRVIRALERSGTKVDLAIAANVRDQVEQIRRTARAFHDREIEAQ